MRSRRSSSGCRTRSWKRRRPSVRKWRIDYAISATGVAGPTGGTPEIPVGTIWLGYGSKDDVRTFQLTEDFGRDINLAIATNKALHLLIDYINEKHNQ